MKKKTIWIVLAAIALVLLVFCIVRYSYVYAYGTKAGVLNTFQNKGVIFKTWEGIIIQSGFKANVESNVFEFSVTDNKLAEMLQRNSGKEVNLHYKRYFGTLPWRGMSTYIVDSIYEVRSASGETTISPK